LDFDRVSKGGGTRSAKEGAGRSGDVRY
jgi:hypothetical protein